MGSPHILHVVGARPNFMKVAPVMRALEGLTQQTLVHTGQHYDIDMSETLFRDLGLRPPDVNLDVGSKTHGVQTGEIMVKLEPLMDQQQPDICVVYGDVNSTMAGALVAAKLGVPVAHVEAGLRADDPSMPEEINRIVTDHVADWLFAPSEDAVGNLAREGLESAKVRFVGNVMIDTLIRMLPQAATDRSLERCGLPTGAARLPYALMTLHRPSTVDDLNVLTGVLTVITEVSAQLPVIFPVHPRSRARIDERAWAKPGLVMTKPLSYLEFLSLQQEAAFVVTDSGGVQEESTYLGIPCVTVRETTERPITVSAGTNTLVGRDPDRIRRAIRRILDGDVRKGTIPALWDGKAAERIAAELLADGKVH